MKNFTTFLLGLFITHCSIAQISPNQFYTPVNTGSNMTLGINTDDLDDFIGSSIAAFNAGEPYWVRNYPKSIFLHGNMG
ncbi:MAG: hypothetical protein CM15mP23_01190 [Cryomorphaceae bacterium]|nr:MAG: hypothetical protein CM15mP23_01190 [Cryomorphaceae bacterium]